MKRLIVILILALSVVAGAQDQTLDNDSILKMVQAGLSENLVLIAIHTQPGKYSLSADDLIKLKQAGVSEKILTAMLTKSSGGATATGMASAPLPTGPVKVAAQTPIRLAFEEPVTSASAKAGDPVKLVVAEDVVMNGQLVFAKGAPATGKVVTVKKKTTASYDGMLEVTVSSVRATDGKDVAVNGRVTTGGGNVSFGRKGKDAVLDKARIMTVQVASETTVGA